MSCLKKIFLTFMFTTFGAVSCIVLSTEYSANCAVSL